MDALFVAKCFRLYDIADIDGIGLAPGSCFGQIDTEIPDGSAGTLAVLGQDVAPFYEGFVPQSLPFGRPSFQGVIRWEKVEASIVGAATTTLPASSGFVLASARLTPHRGTDGRIVPPAFNANVLDSTMIFDQAGALVQPLVTAPADPVPIFRIPAGRIVLGENVSINDPIIFGVMAEGAVVLPRVIVEFRYTFRAPAQGTFQGSP